uniref:Uncharacterized protein n=1 Tax=Moorena producens (strain JHB) TaxID=1454205 RepID=A0A1D9FWY9_MOOP1
MTYLGDFREKKIPIKVGWAKFYYLEYSPITKLFLPTLQATSLFSRVGKVLLSRILTHNQTFFAHPTSYKLI